MGDWEVCLLVESDGEDDEEELLLQAAKTIVIINRKNPGFMIKSLLILSS
jgi:hypothetical protein